MKEVFLEKNQLYIIRIVEELYKSQNNEISYKELSEILDIDKRVANRLIEELVDYDSKQEKPHFKYENHILSELYDFPPHPSELLHVMIKDTIKYKIIKNIFWNETCNGTDMSYDLGVSRSIFQKHVAALRKLMRSFNIDFSFYSKEIMKGDEVLIRFFFHSLLWELDINSIYNESTIIKDISAFMVQTNPNIDFFTLQRFLLSAYITEKRTEKKHFVKNSPKYDIEDHPTISFREFYMLTKETGIYKYCTNENIEKSEARHLYFVYCSIVAIPLVNDDSQEEITTHSDQIIENFIELARKELPFRFTTSEINYLKYNLYYLHNMANTIKGNAQIFGAQNLASKIKTIMPKDFNRILELINVHLAKNHKVKELVDRFPPLYYIYVLLLAAIFKQHKPVIKLLLQTKVSPLQLEQLEWIITSTSMFPVEIISMAESDKAMPDAIMSDWIPPEQYHNIPFFNLSTVTNNSNFTKLEFFLCSLVDEKFTN
ncbi:MAG: helix-turn-helix domain-containing protein [Lachnospiraceae bacterium]|jgi:hypothetical protein|nr:helix-turn-helix domain-containing protein [Lachnospiraceae bacterium]